MLNIFAIFLPCYCCLAGTCVLIWKKEFTSKNNKIFLVWVSALSTIYFLTDAFHIHTVIDSYTLYVSLDVIGKLASLCLLPFSFLYLRSLRTRKRIPLVFYSTLLYATAFIAAIAALYIILGRHWAYYFILHITQGMEYMPGAPIKALTLLEILYKYVYRLSILAELMLLLVYIIINLIKLHTQSSRTTNDSYVLKIFGWTFALFVTLTARMALFPHLYLYPMIAAASSGFIAIILYNMYLNEVFFSLNIAMQTKNKEISEMVLKNIPDPLIKKFESVMNEKLLFLIPSITIDTVAMEIGSNRTYVSQLVQNTYSMTFNEYINHRRIEYGKEYILNHTDAIQEDIALKCGYSSAAAFNKRFKEITGMTPKEWKIINKRQEE